MMLFLRVGPAGPSGSDQGQFDKRARRVPKQSLVNPQVKTQTLQVRMRPDCDRILLLELLVPSLAR